MLPSERRRLDDIAIREAAGESLWTEEFDYKVRVRLAELWSVFAEEVERPYGLRLHKQVAKILRAWAGFNLQAFDGSVIRSNQFSVEILLDGLAATAIAIENLEPHRPLRPDYERAVNDVLREHRIAHKFVDGELVPFKSDELLQEVVEPALRLMADSRFAAAHDSYLKALKEISRGDPGDAITDAGTALQEALTALGCEGDVLGMLIRDAKRKGLFKSHDTQLHEAMILVTKWAASERNKNSDAHKHTDASLADAWLMVHVVGALIVRLADHTLRGEAAPEP